MKRIEKELVYSSPFGFPLFFLLWYQSWVLAPYSSLLSILSFYGKHPIYHSSSWGTTFKPILNTSQQESPSGSLLTLLDCLQQPFMELINAYGSSLQEQTHGHWWKHATPSTNRPSPLCLAMLEQFSAFLDHKIAFSFYCAISLMVQFRCQEFWKPDFLKEIIFGLRIYKSKFILSYKAPNLL